MKKQIVIVIILLLGIAVSVFLSQKQQILKSRASQEIYNAFAVYTGDSEHFVNCTGNVCTTNTLNITMSVKDLTALELREEVEVAKIEEPVVDDQSQNSALSSYFKSAQDVADKEDQEFARERGLPDAEAQSVIHTLVSTLEKGQDIPDELWQDYGSKLGDLSQGAVDLVTSQVREAQEKGEQEKAQEELAKTEAAAAQQQEKITQALDKWSGMSVLERADTLREYYNLPPGTDPEQVLSFYDKAMTVGGFEFRSGPQASTVGPYGVHLNSDLSSFIITDERSTRTSEYLSTATPDLVGIVKGAIDTGQNLYEISQEMPPSKMAEIYLSLTPGQRDKFNEAIINGTKEVTGTLLETVAVSLPIFGSAFLQDRANEAGQRMTEIAQQLKNPDLTPEEKEALKQEYFSALGQIQDINRDIALNAAFDLVGGVPGSKLAEKAAGKGSLAAKELFVDAKAALQAAKQAGKEGLEGVWVGGRQLATDERGSWDFFGLLGKKGRKELGEVVKIPDDNVSSVEKVTDVLSRINEDQFRNPNGTIRLQEFKENLSMNLRQAFDPKGNIPEVTDRLAHYVVDQEGGLDLLVKRADLADRTYIHFRTQGIDRITPETPQDVRRAIRALEYDSELFVKEGRFRSLDPATQKAEILQAIIKQERNMKGALGDDLGDARKTLDALRDFSIERGEKSGSFSHVSQVIEDSSRFHAVDEDVLFKVYGKEAPGLSGLTIPKDGNILVGTWTGSQDLLHECLHGCGLVADPSRVTRKALYEVMGSRSDADRVMEGFVTQVEGFGATLRGKTPAPHNFVPEVNSAEQIIVQMAENLGVSLDRAQAKAIALTVQDRFDEIVKIAGPEKVKSILRDNPTNLPDRFPVSKVIVTPLEKNLAIADALEDAAKLKGTGSTGSSGKLPWNLLVGEVLAQSENLDDVVLNSASFELLVKMKLAKRVLERNGRLDNLYIEDLLKRDIFASEVVNTKESLLMITGKTGTAEGEIGEGQYLVNLSALQNSNIKIPSFVEVRSGTTFVPVAIREGSGKVEKTAGLSKGIGGEDIAKVRVAVYYDENSNGKWDQDEKALPWAGIQVSLTRVNQEKTVSLLLGWNLITLPALPVKPLTAKGLLAQIVKQGGSASAVSTLENGAWKSYVVQENNDYSRDNFTIEPGKAYFVNALKHSTFSFTGQEFALPIKVSLKEGWNAVGFPKLSKQFKARDLGASEDFIIEENRGYLLKLEQGVDFIP